MSILRTHNLQNPDSSSINIVMDQGGNTNITGVTTVGSNFHVTSGLVGIGTDNPTNAYGIDKSLHVHSSLSSGTRGSGVHLTTNASGNTANDGVSMRLVDTDLSIDNRETGLINFLTAGTERLRITSSGQIEHQAASGDNQFISKRTNTTSSAGDYFFHLKARNNSPVDVGYLGFHRDTANDDARFVIGTRNPGGSTTERLRIDSAGRLLIGTTSLIDSSTASNFQIASSSGPRLCIARNNTTVTGGNLMGAIDFYGNDSNGTYELCGRILCEADGTHGDDDKPTRMAFYTTPSGSDQYTERLRITNAGHVSIVGDNQKLLVGSNDDIEIYHDGNSRVRHIGAGDLLLQSNSDVYIQRASDGHQMIIAENDGPVKLYYDNTERFKTVSNGTQTTGRIFLNGTNGGFDYNNTAHTLEFLVSNGTTHSELNSSAYVPGTNGGKHLGNHNKRWNYLFCNGIRFGGENSDAHTLDDYEEGTYTPTYQNFTTTGTSTLVGKYVKVGRQVTVGIKWSCTGTIAHSTSAFVSLPFAMTYGQEYNGLIGMLHNNNSTSQTSGKSGVQCKLDGEGGSRFFPGVFTTTSSGETLLFGGTYIAAS